MSTVAENFRARGDMLIEGVHLLVDHGIGQVQFDEKKKTFLHNDINEIRDQYDRDMMAVKDFQTCQSYLEELLKRLISFLHA